MIQNTWKQFRDNPSLIPTQYFIEKLFVRLMMPNSLIESEVSSTFAKCNLILSNMPSSLKAKWMFNQGCQVNWVSLVSCNPKQPFVSLVTHHDTVKLTITADSAVFPESK